MRARERLLFVAIAVAAVGFSAWLAAGIPEAEQRAAECAAAAPGGYVDRSGRCVAPVRP